VVKLNRDLLMKYVVGCGNERASFVESYVCANRTSKKQHSFIWLVSSHLTSFHLNWVRCEVTQFSVAVTNQDEVSCIVSSDWLQPGWTGSLHSAASSHEI